MEEQLVWRTEQRKINDLIPFLHNPRQMTEKQVEMLTKSLKKFGLVEIPAIDTDNTIIAGHQRLKILQILGKGEEIIDVRVPNRKLTPEEFSEYNLRSNKNVGGWDFDELLNFFDKDMLFEVGFTIDDLHIGEEDLKVKPVAETDKVEGMDLMGFESYNYIVVLFDNELDWLNAQQIFNLKKIDYSPFPNIKKVGLGRFIKGAEFLSKLKDDK